MRRLRRLWHRLWWRSVPVRTHYGDIRMATTLSVHRFRKTPTYVASVQVRFPDDPEWKLIDGTVVATPSTTRPTQFDIYFDLPTGATTPFYVDDLAVGSWDS